MTRWLGIDLGEKRVGLAVADGDPSEAIARPFATLRRGRDIDADAAQLAAVIEREGIDVLVVGLPLGRRGSTGLAHPGLGRGVGGRSRTSGRISR